MGIEANISYENFPKQGRYLGCRASVCFNYDSSKVLHGTVVRDDAEAPGRCIIALDNGRYVLTTECMWSPEAPAKANS